MKKITLRVLTITIAAVSLFSCSEEEVTPSNAALLNTDPTANHIAEGTLPFVRPKDNVKPWIIGEGTLPFVRPKDNVKPWIIGEGTLPFVRPKDNVKPWIIGEGTLPFALTDDGK